FMLLGGEPLPHPTVIWWNFIDRDQAGLQQSVKDWNEAHHRFGDIDLEGTSLKRLIAPDLVL
ncbi:MAG: pirin family protein, partial [Moraxellaceae bacterium]